VAFKNYLGEENKDIWASYDAVEVMKAYKGPKRDILVDQGTDDEFLNTMLMPDKLQEAAAGNPGSINLKLNIREGFNHSYFFVSTFIGDHIAHHAKILSQ